jgi:hypothetical protein
LLAAGSGYLPRAGLLLPGLDYAATVPETNNFAGGGFMVSRWVVALTLAIAVGCSHPKLGPGDVYNSQTITEDEIVASRASNAYEVIHKLRANFLTNRGETSFNRGQSNPYPTVYLDDQEFGPISSLTTIPAAQITLIRLYRVSEANAKYGTHNVSGVIAITTRH